MMLMLKMFSAIVIALKYTGLTDIGWNLAVAPLLIYIGLKIVYEVITGVIEIAVRDRKEDDANNREENI